MQKMRIKSIYVVIALYLLSIVFLFNGVSNSQDSQVDPYPSIAIPVMKGAYRVKRFFNEPKGTKSLNYHIKIKYPADIVIKYYESHFKGLGWISSKDETQRQWECFIDSTIETKPKVRQFLASWSNPKSKVEAFLALRYIKVGDKWSNELYVICQIQPLINRAKLEKFMKHLEDTGQLSKFIKLINCYRMTNGEVDLDKAIKENPNNNYLKEYKKIAVENGITP